MRLQRTLPKVTMRLKGPPSQWQKTDFHRFLAGFPDISRVFADFMRFLLEFCPNYRQFRDPEGRAHGPPQPLQMRIFQAPPTRQNFDLCRPGPAQKTRRSQSAESVRAAVRGSASELRKTSSRLNPGSPIALFHSVRLRARCFFGLFHIAALDTRSGCLHR